MANQIVTPVFSERLPSSLQLNAGSIGQVGLIVSDLQRSLAFYAAVIGLAVLTQTRESAHLGVDADKRVLLQLEQRPGVRALRSKRLGLFHTALLLPSRAALASFVEHLQQCRTHVGSSNHLVSEAFYLEDPDGLAIEVYADREREVWPWRGKELEVATLPLDLASLLSTPHDRWRGIPSGTTMGHIHLAIGDLERGKRLYQHGLGMNPRTQGFPGALFLAAGDYHHHVGLNTWAGAVPSASHQNARLSCWELLVPNQQRSALQEQMLASGWQLGRGEALVDPWGIALQLASNG